MAKLAEDIDALFKLPLPEFIGARKTLAARLKKSGYTHEAESVKALAKPSLSAWTVNQLFWTEREAFDELIATGQRVRRAQTSGKMLNMREALEARREALAQLTELATDLLRDAGHNPSLDTLRRITTTLEAMSSFASASDGPTPGRLTQDIDPPGFDSFGSFTSGPSTAKRAPEPRHGSASKISGTRVTKAPSPSTAATAARELEKRQVRINTAKASLKNARKALSDAQAMVKSVEAAQKRAEAAAKEAERQKRQAEERFKKATAASRAAVDRARTMATELTSATEALVEAKRTVEKATRELEAAFRETPATAHKGKSH